MAISIKTSLKRKSNGIKSENAIAYFQSLNDNKVSSGFHKDVGAEILKRAIHTEFGGSWYEEPFGASGKVPPRPIVRMYLYPEMREGITKTYSQNINSEKNKKLTMPSSNARGTLEEVGKECSYLQKEKVFLRGFDESTNKTPYDPNYNGEKTINWKGFDQPWIGRSGQTVDAIDYKVEKR